MTESNTLEQNCPNSSPRLNEAVIKPRVAYRTVRREKRSTADPVKISTTYDIVGHSENPFQQRKNFYPDLNYTDIIVEAHNVSLIKRAISVSSKIMTHKLLILGIWRK